MAPYPPKRDSPDKPGHDETIYCVLKARPGFRSENNGRYHWVSSYLNTTDNHSLGAYRADPAGKPKGGLVVIQEIFGVNHHIRAVCDRFAASATWRSRRRCSTVSCAISSAAIRPMKSRMRAVISAIPIGTHMMADMAAAGDLKGTGPIGIVGFCMGGTVAFLAACRCGLSAAVCLSTAA